MERRSSTVDSFTGNSVLCPLVLPYICATTASTEVSDGCHPPAGVTIGRHRHHQLSRCDIERPSAHSQVLRDILALSSSSGRRPGFLLVGWGQVSVADWMHCPPGFVTATAPAAVRTATTAIVKASTSAPHFRRTSCFSQIDARRSSFVAKTVGRWCPATAPNHARPARRSSPPGVRAPPLVRSLKLAELTFRRKAGRTSVSPVCRPERRGPGLLIRRRH